MITVWIPSLLRDLTGGRQQVTVDAATLRELIDRLDEQCPGMKARLVQENRLRPGLMVVVNGTNNREGMRLRLEPGSEVHFVPALSGG